MSRAALRLCALFSVLAIAIAGCSAAPLPAPQSPAIHEDPRLMAGIARADITPPPGLSLFGHGPEGRVSVGTLLRLYCEAFVFTKDREAVALVPCDIGAPSQELQREVALRVMNSGVPLGADRILLMATHTHAGPAHYFGSKQYSSTFSSRVPGFDPEVLHFIAERIATAVRVAYKSRSRARLSWRIDSMGGDGLVKNRSVEAFVLNGSLPRCLKKRLDPEDSATRGVSTALTAVDKTLSVLRIDHAQESGEVYDPPRPMGGFVVFGVHNTAIPNTNDVYHSDVFGFALRGAEAMLNKRHAGGSLPAPLLIGIANGIEGDVSPLVGFRGVGEARRLGEELSRRIVQSFEGEKPPKPDDCNFYEVIDGKDDLTRVYRELYLPNAIAHEPPPKNGVAQPPYRLCEGPEIGSAAAGGAEDGPTRFRIFPEMNEGARAPFERPCQGRKLPLRQPPGVGFVDDGLDFPNTAPLELVRLGGVTIAAAPFEMTTVVGVRIRARLESEITPKGRVVVVGLTNSYLQYVTTADEYARQNYEGASTLYGPSTAAFLEGHFVCLSRALSGDTSLDKACRMGQERELNKVYELSFKPVVVSRMPDAIDDEEEHIELNDLAVVDTFQDLWPAWLIRFKSPSPGSTTPRERQRVRIVDHETGRIIDDDTGTNIELRYDLVAADRRTWIARWVPRYSPKNPECARTVHFELESAGRFVSTAFKVRCPRNQAERPSETVQQAPPQQQIQAPPPGLEARPAQPPSQPSQPQEEGSR